MQTIGQQQMLAHMERVREDGKPHEFSIVFVRGTGKLEGSLKSVQRCRKLGHALHERHKERGTLPLFDVIADRATSPFLDNIILYNGMKVKM